MNSRKIGKIVSIRNNTIIGEIYPNIRNYINTLDETLFVGEIGSYVSIYNFDKIIIAEIVAIDATTDIHEKNYNKPQETKKVILNLVGELQTKENNNKNNDIKNYTFNFGVSRMPLIFSDIYITSKEEINGMFNITSKNINKYLKIGTSIINDNYEVKANINNLFGSHFAVLGNTGAGKSNTIASIIQTIFNTNNNTDNTNNATFIFIDSNGEYADAWSELSNNNVKVIQYKVPDDLVNNKPNPDEDKCEDDTPINTSTNEQTNSENTSTLINSSEHIDMDNSNITTENNNIQDNLTQNTIDNIPVNTSTNEQTNSENTSTLINSSEHIDMDNSNITTENNNIQDNLTQNTIDNIPVNTSTNEQTNSENTSTLVNSYEHIDMDNNNITPESNHNNLQENSIENIENENHIEIKNLEIPVWALSADDWAVLLQATEKTQLPVLYRAIEFAKIFYSNKIDTNEFKNFIYARVILNTTSSSDSTPTKADKLLFFLSKYNTNEINLNQPIAGISLIDVLKVKFGQFHFEDKTNIETLNNELYKYIEAISMEQYKELIKNNNVKYNIEEFKEMLELAIMYEGSLNSSRIYEYTSTLLIRLDAFINSNQSKVFTKTKCNTTNAYIKKFITDKNIINIDLSNLDDLSAEIIVKVLSKILLEYLKSLENRASKPINLIVEEAHRYIRNENQYGALNYNIFDRIAKEGRKYGFLMGVSSQRPSDLSKTVLSQCSNFIIHRIQNPEDLHYIGKMVPFINDNMLSQITYIQTGLALVFGSAVNVPIIAKFDKAKPATNSHNADIMKCWYGNDK